MSAVISKAAARAAGLKRYFTGKPCGRGHVAERYVSGHCVSCRSICARGWRERNPESASTSRRRWIEQNPAQQKRARDAWRRANPDRQKAATSAWEAANRERKATSKRKWDLANPAKTRLYVENRRARKLFQGGDVSPGIVAALWEQQAGRCACPCKAPLQRYHIDHVVALANGGAHADHNLQLLTPRCNQRKGTKSNTQFFAEQQRRHHVDA